MTRWPPGNSRLGRIFRAWLADETATIDLKSPKRAVGEGETATGGNMDAAVPSSPLEIADPVWLGIENFRPSPLTSTAPLLYVEAVLLKIDRERGEAEVVTVRWNLRVVASLDHVIRRFPGEIAPGRKAYRP